MKTISFVSFCFQAASVRRIGTFILLLAVLITVAPVDIVQAKPPGPEAFLVEDIVPGHESSSPHGLSAVNGELFFFVQNSVSEQYELRRSRSIEGVTQLIKGFDPQNLRPMPIWKPIEMNGLLIFFMENRNGTLELWRSDGTEMGTQIVKSFYPMQFERDLFALTVVEDNFYFTANDGIHGEEVWRSDSTPAGTVMVADIFAGSGGSLPRNFTAVGNLLYFTANDGTHGFELWRSDGTPTGTELVKDIFPGEDGSNPNLLTEMNGFLYFSAGGGAAGDGLWKSDGTLAGTSFIKEIDFGYQVDTMHLTVMDHKLYFSAIEPSSGYELWQSDGTTDGTKLLKDINPNHLSSNPRNLTNINDQLFFSAFNGVKSGLWQSDGTSEGTMLIKYVEVVTNQPFYTAQEPFVFAYGNIYFVGYEDAYGFELWQSNGSEAGTHMVRDIFPGMCGALPMELTAVNKRLYFSASDSECNRYYFDMLNDAKVLSLHGRELWSLAYFTYIPSAVR